MKRAQLAHALSLLFIAVPAFAQDAQRLEKIEITGSSIRRVQEEGAVPVQIISRQEIQRRGITSAEELMMQISANGTGADNLSSNVGIQLGTTDRNNNGNASANLRGLGASSTLVLLNGQRLAPHGAKGNAVDLSSIPLAAIERVEVLKDGASAIYGTDAIAGVINFILRRDYQGVEATAFADATEKGGGNIYRGNLIAGWGDLGRDRWNVMGTIDWTKQEALNARSRSFASGYQPERGLSPDTAGTAFASQTGLAGTAIGATFRTPQGGTQTFNRANLLSFQGKCDILPYTSQYNTALWASPGARYACAYDYGGAETLIQPVERTQGVLRGTFQVTNNVTAFAELVATKTKATKFFEELQVTTTGSFSGMQYPVGGPYYQDLSAFIPTFDPTKPIAYRWRCVDCGQRTIQADTDLYRISAGLEGTVMSKYDWKIYAGESKSKSESTLQHGYMYTVPFTAALGSGLVNPWLLPGQAQTAAGMALLDAARADGAKLFDGTAKTTEVDGSISGELFNVWGGPVAAALGFDWRKESYTFSDGSRGGNAPAIYQEPFDADFPFVERTVKAVYAEMAVPLFKHFEATLAVRHDKYSDFGGTTNPKVSIKWNPVNQFLLRASYNEGFRAPSFFQLYGASGDSPVPGNVADPVLCPNGNVAGADLSVCAIRPNGRAGGNPGLQPETSKSWSVGFVVEPWQNYSASADLWQIRRKGLIYELTPQQVLANYQQFPGALVRGANGRLDDPGAYIRAGFVNADGDITKGVDVNFRARPSVGAGRFDLGLDGTYMIDRMGRIFVTQDWVHSVGQWNDRDLFPRWKHVAHAGYETGPWSTTLYQFYTRHYKDFVPVGTIPPGYDPNVHSYITYTLAATYSGFKNLRISGGVKNLFDQDPPFTAHNLDFAAGAGWDPRVADPRGRSYYLSLSYKFL